MWVLGQKGALGIKRLCNGHGDVTAVSTGPPPVMDLGIKRPGLLGGPVERTTHRPRFGASPSLLCSSVTKKRTKCHEAFFFWVADFPWWSLPKGHGRESKGDGLIWLFYIEN